ncbi:MAG: hypothetical protein AUK29_01865 [Nitrospirae bacterium CG2_30_53_67]|nr:MAG: hypothetical protein AUK29_01865 [Nitrospirae bacterium CG2_30_53_67]
MKRNAADGLFTKPSTLYDVFLHVSSKGRRVLLMIQSAGGTLNNCNIFVNYRIFFSSQGGIKKGGV